VSPSPPAVSVSHPVEREVTEYAVYTARIAAVDSVEVRARVWGYLEKVNFKEGDLVTKGDVLFQIDPRTYQAALDEAKAKVQQDRAQLAYHEADLRRYEELAPSGAAAKSDLDRVRAARDADLANIAAGEAAVASCQLDLNFTKVIAPVSGRVSSYNVTVGNLIQSGNLGSGTLLTTIVSVDPIYAYFDVDENTVQRLGQLIREGKLTSHEQVAVPVSLGLAAQEGFPHQGTIDFVDNQVNRKTGTLRARGVFPNTQGALVPGYFARIKVPVSAPHEAVLVSDRALDTDQGQKIVYVVGEDNKVTVRPVRVSALHDGLREIADGLEPGERVIVNGLQQVRPGDTVEPTLVDMPAPMAPSQGRAEYR
jgi:RND family efflux transporter MFP subunit